MPAGKVFALTQITRAMERVGFLLPSGTAPHMPLCRFRSKSEQVIPVEK